MSTPRELADASRMGVTNTSAHLQVLRQARLVETRREGVKVFYRLADEEVCRFFFALRDLGRARLAEVEQVVRVWRPPLPTPRGSPAQARAAAWRP